MSTDKADEQEAPGVRINETDEEDTSGHKLQPEPVTADPRRAALGFPSGDA